MSKHRWEQWVESKETVNLLWKARARLKAAWEGDQKDAKSYPMDTFYVLAEIQAGLSGSKIAPIRPPKLKEPKRLADLVPEELIKTMYEEHHAGTFREAIRRAHGIDYKDAKKGWKAFQGILRAMEMAYLVWYLGPEFSPRPKVSILHRGLDQIAKAAGLDEQTEAGFAEFLDDLCPCGIARHKEAIRKLASRSPRIRRPTV